MTRKHRVMVVGLGTIARTHHAVLDSDPTVDLVAAVDPDPGFSPAMPTFETLDEAFDAVAEPDLVVVATPTETHVDIVTELLGRSQAMVLSEKPLAVGRADLERLHLAHGTDRVASRVRVAHHFAFSPEVEWARQTVAQHPDWGRPTEVLSVFNDAYGALPPSRTASLVSSWVDSGPNQLSLVAPFVGGLTVITHAGSQDRSVTVLGHDGGRTTLSSNWLAGDSSKQTVIRFADVDVEVRMDHTSMTGLVVEAGRVSVHHAYTGTAARKVAHYRGLYRAVLGDASDVRLGVALAADIAEVLESGLQAQGRSDGVTWSSSPDS